MSLTIHTSTGPLKVELALIDSPQTIHLENFLVHCAKGSYDHNKILRFIPNFILQTGDTSNTGKVSEVADPGHAFKDIDISQLNRSLNDADNTIRRGTMFAVNNSESQDKLGSQFFFVLDDAHSSVFESGDYTLLGHVIDGLKAIEEIENDPELNNTEKAKKSGKPRGKWKKDEWIVGVEIHNNPFT